ncbi:hypothetical protein [Arthrobacter sp. G119Y2]|uniref:hypothetical protein n=1 Tax=Arthrobacter sp. G119Y2 TaxID=3134965 RepID=UPI00311A17C0
MKPGMRTVLAVGVPVLLLATACEAGTAESQSQQAAPSWAAEMQKLQSELASSHEDGAPEEKRAGGGTAGPDAPNQLRLDPLLTGPLDARFICDAGAAVVSISGGPDAEVPCGPVKVISGINPYEEGTGISIEVRADQELHWAVEFY